MLDVGDWRLEIGDWMRKRSNFQLPISNFQFPISKQKPPRKKIFIQRRCGKQKPLLLKEEAKDILVLSSSRTSLPDLAPFLEVGCWKFEVGSRAI
jgi:hypothetical protein